MHSLRQLQQIFLLSGAFASALIAFVACGEEPPLPLHRVTFISTADGSALAGVSIRIDGRDAGATGESGELTSAVRGRNGTRIEYAVQCPVGHRAPAEHAPLVLREFRAINDAQADRGIEVRIECPPSERRIAVAVKAQNGANLPLLVQGREVTRTDANGYAHVFVRSSPDASFRVSFDTSSQPLLRPTNPMHEFRVADRDDYFLLEQPFVIQEVPVPVVKRRPRRPRTKTVTLPYKIPSRRN